MLPLAPPVSPLPGTVAVRVCGGAAIPYTQNGLALGFGSAWVVCTREQRVQRITAGKVVASVSLPVEPWAIAAGEGAVWTLARDGTAVYRISPTTNRVTGHVELGAAGVYLWALAGAVWVADDADRMLIRVAPVGLRVSARVPAGDGPSGLAYDGTYLWLVSHRENSLDRIDPTTLQHSNGIFPSDRRSPLTRWPVATGHSTIEPPMYPVAPVMKTFMFLFPSSNTDDSRSVARR